MCLRRVTVLLTLMCVSLLLVSCSEGLSGVSPTPTIQKVENPLWVWVSGSEIANESGRYGVKGVASSNNVPSAREDAVSWVDSKNRLWLFGGIRYSGRGSSYDTLDDLWTWDGTNWIWMAGSSLSNQPAIYGEKGIPDSNNTPGAREDAISWVDSNDVLWLFGGLTHPDAENQRLRLNDLWSWDGTSWTWVAGGNVGDELGVYGNKGEPSATNTPGARDDSIAWVDSSDNLWLFGGSGYDSTATLGDFNDLWRWDGANWTWISGSEFVNMVGIYGTKGQPADTNMPGGREDGVAWTDSNDNLWMFGGVGVDSSGAFFSLNDMWRWDGTNWTWIAGSDVGNQIGSYGIKGSAAESNYPGSRTDSVAWIDKNNEVWLFGGRGLDKFGTEINALNDFWKWNGNDWIWVGGSDVASQWGVYGDKGVAAPTNIPGSRSNSVAWIDNFDNLWIFGGKGNDRGTASNGSLNDLWQYKRFEYRK